MKKPLRIFFIFLLNFVASLPSLSMEGGEDDTLQYTLRRSPNPREITISLEDFLTSLNGDPITIPSHWSRWDRGLVRRAFWVISEPKRASVFSVARSHLFEEISGENFSILVRVIDHLSEDNRDLLLTFSDSREKIEILQQLRLLPFQEWNESVKRICASTLTEKREMLTQLPTLPSQEWNKSVKSIVSIIEEKLRVLRLLPCFPSQAWNQSMEMLSGLNVRQQNEESQVKWPHWHDLNQPCMARTLRQVSQEERGALLSYVCSHRFEGLPGQEFWFLIHIISQLSEEKRKCFLPFLDGQKEQSFVVKSFHEISTQMWDEWVNILLRVQLQLSDLPPHWSCSGKVRTVRVIDQLSEAQRRPIFSVATPYFLKKITGEDFAFLVHVLSQLREENRGFFSVSPPLQAQLQPRQTFMSRLYSKLPKALVRQELVKSSAMSVQEEELGEILQRFRVLSRNVWDDLIVCSTQLCDFQILNGIDRRVLRNAAYHLSFVPPLLWELFINNVQKFVPLSHRLGFLVEVNKTGLLTFPFFSSEAFVNASNALAQLTRFSETKEKSSQALSKGEAEVVEDSDHLLEILPTVARLLDMFYHVRIDDLPFIIKCGRFFKKNAAAIAGLDESVKNVFQIPPAHREDFINVCDLIGVEMSPQAINRLVRAILHITDNDKNVLEFKRFLGNILTMFRRSERINGELESHLSYAASIIPPKERANVSFYTPTFEGSLKERAWQFIYIAHFSMEDYEKELKFLWWILSGASGQERRDTVKILAALAETDRENLGYCLDQIPICDVRGVAEYRRFLKTLFNTMPLKRKQLIEAYRDDFVLL